MMVTCVDWLDVSAEEACDTGATAHHRHCTEQERTPAGQEVVAQWPRASMGHQDILQQPYEHVHLPAVDQTSVQTGMAAMVVLIQDFEVVVVVEDTVQCAVTFAEDRVGTCHGETMDRGADTSAAPSESHQ